MIVLIELIGVLLLAIIVHELTHYFYAIKTGSYLGFDFEDGAPTVHFKDGLNQNSQMTMYGLAILNGLIVIIPFIFLSTNGLIHILTLFIYLYGCHYDLYKMMTLIRQHQHLHIYYPSRHDR